MRYQRLANSLGFNPCNASFTRVTADGHAQRPYRSRLALAGLASSCAVLSLALDTSAAYPERPLRYIVPFAAGSGGDITARLLAAPGSLATNVAGYKKLAYDAVRDFAPITQSLYVPILLVIHPSLP